MSDESRAALEEAWDAAEAAIEEEDTDSGVADPDASGGDAGEGALGEPDGGDDEGGIAGDIVEGETGEDETETVPPAAAVGEEGDVGEESAGEGDQGESGRVDNGPQDPAPASWTPQAREAWLEIPPEARAEIQRRETEVNRALEDSAASRREFDRLQQAAKPFEQTIAIEAGGDMVAAAQNLFGFAHRLRFGTQAEKAQAMTFLVSNYGVDIEALDSALAATVTQPGAGAGNPPPGNPIPAPAATSDPRLEQMWQEREQGHQQAASAKQQEVQAFLTDPKNEFANDVRNDMADIIQFAVNRGEPEPTLQEAYDRACQLNTGVQAVLAQRAAGGGNGAPAAGAQGSGAPAASLRAKKRASKSVTGSPTGGNEKPTPQTREDHLRAAWDAQENV